MVNPIVLVFAGLVLLVCSVIGYMWNHRCQGSSDCWSLTTREHMGVWEVNRQHVPTTKERGSYDVVYKVNRFRCSKCGGSWERAFKEIHGGW
jgi:hypothetical protein